MIEQTEILDNLTNQEKLDAICRSRNIDKDDIVTDIITKIHTSDIDDQDIYVGESEIWDEEYITSTSMDVLYIKNWCEPLLLNREEAIEFFKEDIEDNDCTIEELWVELSTEEKEFLRLALELEINEISVQAMR